MVETIISIVAHNDDHILSAAGTLAKWAKQGKRIITIVCSYEEKAQLHLRKDVVIKRKHRESQKADEIIQGQGVIYLDLATTKEIQTGSRKLAILLKKEQPSTILTHPFMFNPTHRAVHNMIMNLINKGIITCPVYAFESKGFARLIPAPKMVVDITETFQTKIKAFLAYKSRQLVAGILLWKMIIKDRLTGILNGCKYAEVFTKLN